MFIYDQKSGIRRDADAIFLKPTRRYDGDVKNYREY